MEGAAEGKVGYDFGSRVRLVRHLRGPSLKGAEGWQVVIGRKRAYGIRGNHHSLRLDIASKQGKGVVGKVTSFFVSNFPEEYGAWDLFNIFERYGHLCEVVIPPRRDIGGIRFGFVRYRDVAEPVRLTVNLGNLFIDTRKLFVNVSRFDKNRVKEIGVSVGKGPNMDVVQVLAKIPEKVWKPKGVPIVGAKVVNKLYYEVVSSAQLIDVQFEVDEANFDLYKKALVGEVWQLGKTIFIQEEFARLGVNAVKVTPLAPLECISVGQKPTLIIKCTR